jgi:hypothetical protein
MSRDAKGLSIKRGQGAVAPTIEVQFESPSIGWTIGDAKFPQGSFTTSTVFRPASDPASRDAQVSFNVTESGLDSMVFTHRAFDQSLIRDESSVVTKFPLQTMEPTVGAFLALGGTFTFRPTDLQQAVFERVQELMDLAAEDNIEMSPSSFWDMWSFIMVRPFVPTPSIFALDSGNFRAVWKNSQGERLALEFQGNKIVGFVIFEFDRLLGKMMRMAGLQVLSQVQAQIAAARVGHLLAP